MEKVNLYNYINLDNVPVKQHVTCVNSKRRVKKPQIKVDSIESSIQLGIRPSQNLMPEIKVYDLSSKLVRSVSVMAD